MADAVSTTPPAGEGWRRFGPIYEASAPSPTKLARLLDRAGPPRAEAIRRAIAREQRRPKRRKKYLAVLLLLRDLMALGWDVRVFRGGIWVRPSGDDASAREVARRQLLHGRADQFAEAGTRSFIERLERPRAGRSVVNLFADGHALATNLRRIASLAREERPSALAEVCRPYLQVARADAIDHVTGASLFHVWRYLRLTWASRYRRVPGRHIAFLIRDAAQENHPVMAIAALSSPVLQLTPRDEWIGWSTSGLARLIDAGVCTDSEALSALRSRVRDDIKAIYANDLGYDADDPPMLDANLERRLRRFEARAEDARARELAGRRPSKTVSMDPAEIVRLARTPLFRGKRATAAIALLRAHTVLSAWRGSIRDALADADAESALAVALRHAKQFATAASVMDITTCGAVPPYGPLLGGKLACLMMLTRFVRDAVEQEYSGQPSVIASQMAGRPITRPARLAMLTTSSLYGERSSQYNRVRLPSTVLLGQTAPLGYEDVGRSVGHGATHLSTEAEAALAAVAAARGAYRNVNFLFGEGQSPKMRQLREATAALGLGSADILRHESPRIAYVAPLCRSPQRVLLGIDPLTDGDAEGDDGVERVAEFWRSRWLASRLDHTPALDAVAQARRASLAISREYEEAPATGWLGDEFK